MQNFIYFGYRHDLVEKFRFRLSLPYNVMTCFCIIDRTDPSCRVAVWNIHAIQAKYVSGKAKPDAQQSGGW